MSVNVRQRPRKSQQPRQRIFKKTTAATDRLRSDIRNGVFKPGQWLNKEKVGREYGVGVTSMETACQALAKEGALEARQWQSRTTYYVPKRPEPTPQPVPAGLLAEARASVALDGETRTLGDKPRTYRTAPKGKTWHEIVADTLRERLANGQYPIGTTLPTQDEIARELGINQPSIWRGMNMLKHEGWIESKPGQSARVVALPPVRAVEKQTTVRQYILDRIQDGTYAPGTFVPNLQAMANANNAGHKTVLYVYRRLQNQGILSQDSDGNWFVSQGSEQLPSDPPPVEPPLKQMKVIDYLRGLILDGTHAGGSAMPALRSVATKMGVSFQAVEQAYDRLATEGLVTIKHGVGVFVAPEPERLPSETPNPFANLIGFVTRLADIGATAELQRLWALEETGLSREAEAKLQADVAELRKELDDAQAENRNLVSGITALREEKVIGTGQFKNLKESYIRLQKAHETVLGEYDQLRKVAQLIGSPQPNGGGVSKLSVEAALQERKPLPARRSY